MTTDIPMVRAYPRRGALHNFLNELVAHTLDHPEVSEPDRYGRFSYAQLGPYCDSAQTSKTAKVLRERGPSVGGTVDAFSRRINGEDYVLVRFIPADKPALHLIQGGCDETEEHGKSTVQ